MDEQARVLSDYRLEKAEQCLRSAEAILQIGEDYNLVVNRVLLCSFSLHEKHFSIGRKRF